MNLTKNVYACSINAKGVLYSFGAMKCQARMQILLKSFKTMKRITKKLQMLVTMMAITFGLFGQDVGDMAPDFTLNSTSGDTFNLSDQKGKVVSIFFFGYGCSHCQSNGPNTETYIYQPFMDNENFQAVAIDVWDGTAGNVNDYINITGISYPVLVLGSSVDNWYESSYDRVVIVDADGIIRYKSEQNVSAGEAQSAAMAVESYLATATIDSKQNEGLHIYPVPATSVLHIESDWLKKENTDLRVVNSIGKTVFFETNFKAQNLEVSDLENGVYFLQLLDTKGRIKSKRFIINK